MKFNLAAGLNRVTAFLGFGNSQRDAARRDIPEMQGWDPQPGFAGNDPWNERETIVGRARSLDKDNAWINGGLDRRVESVIGGAIRLSAQPVIELLNRDFDWRMNWTADVQARYKVWGNDIERRCDARQQFSFGQLARLAYLTYIRDGECAAEIRDDNRGLSNTTNVLLFDAIRISTPTLGSLQEGPRLRNGVAFDAGGAAIGYWIRTKHPADHTGSPKIDDWEYVPRFGKTGRAKIIHVYSPRYAEQNRGISRLAEAMVPAKMLDRVDRAEVQAALKSAILSFFIKSPGSTEELAEALAPTGAENATPGWLEPYLDFRGKHPFRMDGASIFQLFPDEDVITPDPTRPNSNYPSFVKWVLQKISSALGISYPQLSQDWSGINYSSARALLNELWRSFLEDRQFFTQQFCTPIYAAWLEVEVANGDVKVPGGPANFYRQKTAICMAEWIGPGRGSVDPLKEENADNLAAAAGRKSTPETILERGRDPSDVLAEEAWYLAERAKRKLPPPNHNVKQAAEAAEAEAAAEDAAEEKRNEQGAGSPAPSEEAA